MPGLRVGVDEEHSTRRCCLSRTGLTVDQHCNLFLPFTCSSPLFFLPPFLLFRGCSPFLNKAVSPSMSSPASSLADTHTATVQCSCQTAKSSLPPGQNRSCLSLRISLPLSLSLFPFSHCLVFSHPPSFFLPPLLDTSVSPYSHVLPWRPQETHLAGRENGPDLCSTQHVCLLRLQCWNKPPLHNL